MMTYSRHDTVWTKPDPVTGTVSIMRKEAVIATFTAAAAEDLSIGLQHSSMYVRDNSIAGEVTTKDENWVKFGYTIVENPALVRRNLGFAIGSMMLLAYVLGIATMLLAHYI